MLTIEGVINPMSARYLRRELQAAERAGAQLVVVRLDTPGGTMAAMRDIVQDILGSTVPVAVHVAPAGARAASAGVFITAAAHVAAMAPGTHLGSAHPVAIGGGGRQKLDETMEQKVVNDAAALARAIASRRSRNADWLERSVRESVSATAGEARELGVVDQLAATRADLLRALDGEVITTAAGRRQLQLANALAAEHPMSLVERIVHAITDPNVAYLLFSLGLIGLAAELYHPGLIFPGVVGGTSLILALIAFGNLPINWGGVLLVAGGVLLVVADALVGGLGLLSLGGVVCLVLGALFLYQPGDGGSPAMPDLSVSPALIAGSAVALVGFSLLVLRALWRTRHEPIRSGPESLVGRRGTALSTLAPRGSVQLDSERWSAVSEHGEVAEGQSVRVVGVEGVTLRVRRDEEMEP
jgi:membrane-bound serine protease (ClpP class)